MIKYKLFINLFYINDLNYKSWEEKIKISLKLSLKITQPQNTYSTISNDQIIKKLRKYYRKYPLSYFPPSPPIRK